MSVLAAVLGDQGSTMECVAPHVCGDYRTELVIPFRNICVVPPPNPSIHKATRKELAVTLTLSSVVFCNARLFVTRSSCKLQCQKKKGSAQVHCCTPNGIKMSISKP